MVYQDINKRIYRHDVLGACHPRGRKREMKPQDDLSINSNPSEKICQGISAAASSLEATKASSAGTWETQAQDSDPHGPAEGWTLQMPVTTTHMVLDKAGKEVIGDVRTAGTTKLTWITVCCPAHLQEALFCMYQSFSHLSWSCPSLRHEEGSPGWPTCGCWGWARWVSLKEGDVPRRPAGRRTGVVKIRRGPWGF